MKTREPVVPVNQLDGLPIPCSQPCEPRHSLVDPRLFAKRTPLCDGKDETCRVLCKSAKRLTWNSTSQKPGIITKRSKMVWSLTPSKRTSLTLTERLVQFGTEAVDGSS
jgi:hypothetical protein